MNNWLHKQKNKVLQTPEQNVCIEQTRTTLSSQYTKLKYVFEGSRVEASEPT